MTKPVDPVAIARDLLRCPSVTPAEGGALAYLEAVLLGAGFAVHRMTFTEPGTADVENLYARIGTASPHLMFAGHAIACKVAATLDHLAANGGKLKGSISFLITGDEEGVAINGSPKLLKWVDARGDRFDHCVLGEPGNVAELGDTIKVGRRGSQNGVLIITGKQGHVAYPHRADNPVRGLVKLMSALMDEPLDAGSHKFDPSNLEFTSIDIGNPTVNLIPGEARARFNIRFNDCHSFMSLRALVEQRAAKTAGNAIRWRIEWEPSNADVFYTERSPFTDVVIGAVAEVTGRTPKLSTSGGTSDARFIKDYCPVVEFGLVGTTMHATDERVPVVDLQALTAVYRTILERYFT
jgi:succinyl-diaminopimelate desuccinylase